MSQTQAAANAELTVNGIPVVRSSNVIDDLLEGVTLNVAAADPGNPFEVKVSRNMGSVITKITAFVDKYNNALTSLGALQTSDLEAGAVGLLQGDSTPRILQMRLQSLLASKVSGIASSVNTLSSLGVSADKDGKLSLNPITFTAAYEANREDVVNFFTQTTTDSEGFAVKFDTLLDSYLQKSTGLLVTKEEGLQRSVDHIGDQVERIQLRLAKREENLTRQFNALESLLGQFQTTSGVLSQQLDALSNLSSQIYKK
jgi:flagellar hook-associated protein 2